MTANLDYYIISSGAVPYYHTDDGYFIYITKAVFYV